MSFRSTSARCLVASCCSAMILSNACAAASSIGGASASSSRDPGPLPPAPSLPFAPPLTTSFGDLFATTAPPFSSEKADPTAGRRLAPSAASTAFYAR